MGNLLRVLERPQEAEAARAELPQPPEPPPPPPVEEAAPVPEPVPEPAPAIAAQLPATPASPVPLATSPEVPRDAEREGRKRPGRRELQRATSAAEQAWGQPIGTPRRAQPPSPLVFEPSPVETEPSPPSSSTEVPAATPGDDTPETD